MLHESFKVFHVIFKDEIVSKVFSECFKCVSRKFQENFHVAWHSSQLPDQKEGLLTIKHYNFELI